MQLSKSIMISLLVSSSASGLGSGATPQNSTQQVAVGLASTANLTNTNVAKSIVFVAKARLDRNQKVYIEGQASLGDGVGQGALNKCRSFASQHVTSPDKPHVKVCGTGIKLTAYLMGNCKKYYQHSRTIGKCQSNMSSDTCDSFSPAQDARFGAYQSYKIEPC
jgi:hypothetical protein